jgi:hypothetical protein
MYQTNLYLSPLKRRSFLNIQGLFAVILVFSNSACQSPQPPPSGPVNQTKTDLKTVQKEDSLRYFKVFTGFRRVAKAQLNTKAVHVEDIRKKHVAGTPALDMKFKQKLIAVFDQIALLTKQLDTFNDEGKENTQMFMLDFEKDLHALDSNIVDLGQ